MKYLGTKLKRTTCELLAHCKVRMSAPLLLMEFTTSSSSCFIRKLLPCAVSTHPVATRKSERTTEEEEQSICCLKAFSVPPVYPILSYFLPTTKPFRLYRSSAGFFLLFYSPCFRQRNLHNMCLRQTLNWA